MSDSKDIEAMIGRVALGERQAFSELFDATSSKLFAVCLRVLKERSAAEDAMQETYIKIWTKAGRYAISGHSPMTWLITIARNTAIDQLRASRPTSNLDDYSEILSADGMSPEQATIARSDALHISACLDELDNDRRAAVKGAYLDGQSYKELAERFDVPLNTMRTWLRRSLASLRNCLER